MRLGLAAGMVLPHTAFFVTSAIVKKLWSWLPYSETTGRRQASKVNLKAVEMLSKLKP